nr:MAG TPA: helicase [Caudoviricetes sp.]
MKMLNFLKNLQSQREAEEKRIKELIETRSQLEDKIAFLNERANAITQANADAQANVDSKLESLRLAESGFGALEEIGYERYVPTMESDNIEKEIFSAEFDIADMMVKEQVVQYNRVYRIDNSKAKGKRFQENYGKNLLIGFNGYVQAKEKAISETNYNRSVELIDNCFAKFNKQGALLGIMLNPKYLTLRKQILKCKLELKIRKARENAKLREERKRMREQEKLLEEIAKEQEQLEKERKSMDIAFAKALTNEERELIKAKMNDIDKRMDNLKYRREHSNAGWLYVISSPSLPNMCKVGCTRRLNPTIRVKELSSSSLPYAFRTHGFVFSDNCFELETQMHHYFDDKRVAPDREFFYISPQEAISVLKNKFNQEVHFEDVENSHEQDSDC